MTKSFMSIHKEFYGQGKWKEYTRHFCKICPFDTLDGLTEMEKHLKEAHFPEPVAPGPAKILRVDRFGNEIVPAQEPAPESQKESDD